MRLAARNLGSNYLAYGASILSGIILTPVIVHAVGQEGYGAWIFIVSLTTMLRLLDFGITPTVVRFTALHRGQRADDEIDALASSSFAVFLALGLVSVLVGLVLAYFLPHMIDLPPDLVRPAQAAAVIAVLTLGTQAPLGLFGSLLKGAQRFDVVNVGTLVSIAAYAVLVVAVLTRHGTLPVLATITLVATVIRLGYPVIFVRRVMPGLRVSRKEVSRDRVQRLLGFSGFAFLSHIAGKIVYSADVIVIGAILGAREVALYGVASRLFALVASVATTGTELLLPLHSELEGRGDHDRQREFLATGVRGGTSVAVLLGLPLVILPTWVVVAWLGTGFAASATPLALLGAAALFTTTSGILAQYIFARGRPAVLAVSQTILGATNLTATVVLLLTVGEIWTAAAATLVVECASAVVVLPLIARSLGVSYRRLAGAWVRPVAAGIVAAIPTLVLARAMTDTTSLAALAVVGALWALLFGAIAWRLALSDGERQLVRRLVGARRAASQAR